MERDNKILLGAVLIMLVGMVSFSFSGVTGRVTRASNEVVVTASPDSLYFSYNDLNVGTKIVTVKLDILSGTIENNLDLYRSNGERVGGRTASICRGASGYETGRGGSSNCERGTYYVNFKFDSELEEGKYFFRANGRETLSGSSFDRQNFDSNLVTVTKYKEPLYG